MKTFKAREGFALPLTMFLLLIMTGAVVMSLQQGTTERRVQDSESGALEALVLAETGLERFSTDATTWTWSGGYPIPSGNAGTAQLASLGDELGVSGHTEIQARRVFVQGDPADPNVALYAVTARGVRTKGGWSDAPEASRVVSRLVRYEKPDPLVADGMFPSAWTSLSGLRKNGNAGELTGYDAASSGYTENGTPCGNMPAKAGVAVPADPGYSGHDKPVSGKPPVLPIGDTPEEAAASIDIDWEKMIDPRTFPASAENVFRIPGEGSWEDISDDLWDEWPVVVVDSDSLDSTFELPQGGGRGTLIVTGDAIISGSNLWEGLVLVGGKLTSNGNNTVSGSVLSGINLKLDGDVDEGEDIYVGEADVGNGTKTFEYHSCYLMNAMEAVNAVPPAVVEVLANTWLDTWAQY